ncbi:hypothetical protein ACNF49_43200 [Actinomadura sp. ATCC 39365]
MPGRPRKPQPPTSLGLRTSVQARSILDSGIRRAGTPSGPKPMTSASSPTRTDSDAVASPATSTITAPGRAEAMVAGDRTPARRSPHSTTIAAAATSVSPTSHGLTSRLTQTVRRPGRSFSAGGGCTASTGSGPPLPR